MSATETIQGEKFQFQAESRQLLDMMIHSIYTNKDIFLRELISNASDAIDKLKFEAITSPELAKGIDEHEIRLEIDKDNQTLTISDTGIGMSRNEVIENIGTIAKSGTKEMIEKIKKEKNSDKVAELIGQFGVGFYAAFMVADEITMTTRRAGEQNATLWFSKGDGEYTVNETTKDNPGTTIVLKLKKSDEEDGLKDYTDTWVVKDIVKKYSDFIAYPVKMKEEVEEPEKDEEGKEIEGKTRKVIEDKTLNSMKPIWIRSKSDVKDEEYNEFYKHISHDWADPVRVIPYRAEGRLEYQALLYIPSKAPFDFYYQDYKAGLQLYVKRVMISESFEELLPRYLRFVKGVVDSSDLPLNISREMLQQDRVVTAIRKGLVTKILSVINEMLEKDRDKYIEFYKEFGPAIKEGANSDFANKDKLTPLLMFYSSNEADKLTTLQEYIDRTTDSQKEIYYLTGTSRELLENSPYLEKFKKNSIEVLYLLDPVDEYVLQSLGEFKDYKLKDISKGDADPSSEKEAEKEKEELEKKSKDFDEMLKALQKHLDQHIKEVRLTSRLDKAPAIIVGDEFDMSPHLEKLLKSQSGAGNLPKSKRILELNPEHDIIKKMRDRFNANKDDEELKEYAEVLTGYAALSEGAELPDPVRFNSLLVKIIEKSL